MGRIPFFPVNKLLFTWAALMAGFEGNSGGRAASRRRTELPVRSALVFEQCCENLVCSCSLGAN